MFFQWFVAPEGRKVGSLKRRVRSHLARWEMKNCMPLWCETQFEIKIYKTPQFRSPLKSYDVEKAHAVLARSTFRYQNIQTTPGPDQFLEVEMSKKWTPLGHTAHFEVKIFKKHHIFAPLLDGEMSFRVAGARDCAPCQKWVKCEFSSVAKNEGVGYLQRICKDAFRVAGAVQKTYSSEILRGQGADFMGGIAFWRIRSVGLLRWFCVTGAALRMIWYPFFVAGAILWTGGVEKSQNTLVWGRQNST